MTGFSDPMRIYYDTEFTNLDGNTDGDMISAGFVSDEGHEWYVEIEDFDRTGCSPFVIETVLPLLGRIPAERVPGGLFGNRLANWLSTFNQDIELINDARCDRWVIMSCARDLDALPRKIQVRTWQRSDDPAIQAALREAEAQYWQAHPACEHHALYDARRLQLIAGLQRRLAQ